MQVPNSGESEHIGEEEGGVVHDSADSDGVLDELEEAEGDQRLVEDVGVLEVNRLVGEGGAGVDEGFAGSVEFESVGRLENFARCGGELLVFWLRLSLHLGSHHVGDVLVPAYSFF